MEDAAVNRLATSITQLTLCQVTADEIDAVTKLLDNRNSEVSQTSHLRESLTSRLPYANYVGAAFWTVAQFLPATKLVKRKKHCCSCRVQLKVQAHHPMN